MIIRSKKSVLSGLPGRIIAPVILLAPVIASAHPGLPGHSHGFANGFAHPLSGLDHLLAMTAVGLWAAQRGGRALWMAPLAFISVMTVGAVLGMAGWGQIPLIDQTIAASVLVMGIFVATASRFSLSAAISLIGLFALFHGYAHGAEMPVTASGLQYGLGFVMATAVLHLCGIGIGLTAQKMNSMKLVRTSGWVIVACGLYLIFTS
jgi:urease accessory protein